MHGTKPLHLAYDIEHNWDSFTRDVWGHQPAVFDVVPQSLKLDADELFDTVIAATDDQGPGLNPAAKFYIDQTAQLVDIDRYTPKRTDGSLKGYFDRIAELTQGHSYLLVINHLNVFNQRLWSNAAHFLSGLYERTNKLPFGLVDIDVFLGEYPCTPFGVHYDGATNFMTVPYGTKRMIVWPDNSSAPVSTRNYEDSRADGIWLDCDSTQMIYWPGFRRHVGEARNGPSASVNLAYYMETRYLDELFDLLERELTTRYPILCSGGELDASDDSPTAMPPLMEEIRAVLPAITGSMQFATQVKRRWLQKYTGYGFTRVAPLTAASGMPLSTASRLEVRHPNRIVWDVEHNILAANGHSRVLASPTNDLARLVRILNEKDCWSLLEIAQAAGIELEPASVAELCFVLEFLVQCRALSAIG